MKKRIFSLALSAAILIGSVGVSVSAKDISVNLNGNNIYLDVAPQIINDRTMVPMRAIFEALGYNVDWNGNSQTVTAKNNSNTITMTIGNYVFYKNGIAMYTDVAPTIISSRTLVPLRAISEASGYSVDWDGNSRTAYIKTGNTISEEEAINIVKNQLSESYDNIYVSDYIYHEYFKKYVYIVVVEMEPHMIDTSNGRTYIVDSQSGQILGGAS